MLAALSGCAEAASQAQPNTPAPPPRAAPIAALEPYSAQTLGHALRRYQELLSKAANVSEALAVEV